ncbi:MAG TPA: response regulator [Methylomirabilota bacterium]|nr:response regulator [Methylomirabilota bacterium]
MADKRGTILVVDDEPPVTEMLADFLAEHDFHVLQAHSGVQALGKLAQEAVDVVLLDVRMPEMDGLEVLKRIREHYPRVGVLMVSGNDDIEMAKQAIGLGAFDVTLKPVDFAYVQRAIDKMLLAAAQAAAAPAPVAPGAAATPSTPGLLYDLALEIFRATRKLSPEARDSVGRELEQAALSAVQRGVSGEKFEVVRALNQVRTLLRFGRDLGDFSDEEHRRLDAQVARARRSVGLT